MKKYLAFALAAVMLLSLLAGCAAQTSEDIVNRDQITAEESGMTIHKIGVATYNIKDAEVMMFKEYLDSYVKQCFTDVTFLYSNSISTSEEMMDFLATCAENGVEGIMMFNSYDLKQEVDFCAGHGMYIIHPSGTFSDTEFNSVSSNPYFVGQIGPGAEKEYEAGEGMTRALAGDGKSYVVLSGGAPLGNEMHLLRTAAILDVLQEVYGVSFGQSSEELAKSAEVTTITVGELELVICPGYIDFDIFRDPAAELIASGDYTTILSVLPVTTLMDALNAVDIECGVIDCFSEDNYFGFKKGKISYVAGKYQSEIGPGFAALYNAITGHGDIYRIDGKAFRLEQGFWTAMDASEYGSMYALACGAGINAYNYEDLYSVINSLTPDVDFDMFKALVESYSYGDCLARRST